VAKGWVSGGVQELMCLGPFQDADVDEQATMLYVSIAFAFGSPPDVGPSRPNQDVVRGSTTQGGSPMDYGQHATVNQNQHVVTVSTTQGGPPVDYGQQATVNPVNFMVYSEDALE
jgi:hypothetical protein